MAVPLGTQLAFEFEGRELSAQYDMRQFPPLPPKQVIRLSKAEANYSGKVKPKRSDSMANDNILLFAKTSGAKSSEKAKSLPEKKTVRKKYNTRTVAQIAQERARGRHPAGKKITNSNNQMKIFKANAVDLKNPSGDLLNESYELVLKQPRKAKAGYARSIQAAIVESNIDLDQAWDTLPAGIKIAQNSPSVEEPADKNKMLFSASSVQDQKLSMFKTGIANLPSAEMKEIVGSGVNTLQNDSCVSSDQYLARENETQPMVLALETEADSSIPLVRKLLVGIAVIAVSVGLGSGLGKYLDSGVQDEQWPADTISYAQSSPGER